MNDFDWITRKWEKISQFFGWFLLNYQNRTINKQLNQKFDKRFKKYFT